MCIYFSYRWYSVPVSKLREKIKEIQDRKYSHEGYRPIIHPKLLEIVEMNNINLTRAYL